MRGFRKKWMAPVKIQESIRDINYLILCPVFEVLISKSKMIYCFLYKENHAIVAWFKKA